MISSMLAYVYFNAQSLPVYEDSMLKGAAVGGTFIGQSTLHAKYLK
jgi:hypothetical protein